MSLISNMAIAEVKKRKYDVFHDRKLFMNDYNEMNKTLKIYAYPHDKDDPFANVLLPLDGEIQIGGNYASESSFKRSLFKSHFLQRTPQKLTCFTCLSRYPI